MRDLSLKTFFLFAALAVFAFPGQLAHAGGTKNNVPSNGMSQTEAQILSHQIHDKGSDESLKNSTVYAMQALMHLAAGELPSAVKNGYNAYGKYRNSENLDKLKDQNAYLANTMTSVGSGPVIAGPMKTNTSFRRLDPTFLSQGEAGKVAAEFERQTGMSRGDFLKQMAEVSEKKIKRSDPMMIDKAFGRFESFLQKIPNAEFRKNAEKSIAKVPDTMRRGLVAQAVQKLAGFFADAGPGASAPPSLDSTITDNAAAKLASNVATPQVSAGSTTSAADSSADRNKGQNSAVGADERAPSSLGMLGAVKPIEGKERLAKDDKNGFGGVVAAALSTQQQDGVSGSGSGSSDLTIFQQITKRYRILTPSISKVAN